MATLRATVLRPLLSGPPVRSNQLHATAGQFRIQSVRLVGVVPYETHRELPSRARCASNAASHTPSLATSKPGVCCPACGCRLFSRAMPIDMNALARVGAEARLAQLREEAAEIHRAFPDLTGARRTRRRPGRPSRQELSSDGEPGEVSAQSGQNESRRTSARRRKGMSAAARKAVSERMRKYWAQRKKAAKNT